mmetsp:Transcript_21881/g.70451  ORF Transcript_21881/g.70451 Transcript_21881/m.70451 type:complete len:251 (+) Transcript_21881:405-1157(+)
MVPEFILDESEQVLLVHAGRVVHVRVHLAHVVKVAVRHALLALHLLVLVQQRVQVEARLQQTQAAVRGGLGGAVVDDAHELVVVVVELVHRRWLVQGGVRNRSIFLLGEHHHHAVHHPRLVVQAAGHGRVERVEGGVRAASELGERRLRARRRGPLAPNQWQRARGLQCRLLALAVELSLVDAAPVLVRFAEHMLLSHRDCAQQQPAHLGALRVRFLAIRSNDHALEVLRVRVGRRDAPKQAGKILGHLG